MHALVFLRNVIFRLVKFALPVGQSTYSIPSKGKMSSFWSHVDSNDLDMTLTGTSDFELIWMSQDLFHWYIFIVNTSVLRIKVMKKVETWYLSNIKLAVVFPEHSSHLDTSRSTRICLHRFNTPSKKILSRARNPAAYARRFHIKWKTVSIDLT